MFGQEPLRAREEPGLSPRQAQQPSAELPAAVIAYLVPTRMSALTGTRTQEPGLAGAPLMFLRGEIGALTGKTGCRSPQEQH
jgi:hypothetical protein